MASEGNHKVDLRIYDLCRSKLQLSDIDAAAVSLELQEMINEDKLHWQQEQQKADQADRLDFEEFIEQRIEFLRRDLHNFHTTFSAELQQLPEAGVHSTEVLQWMFTYFAFQMGGIIALILLLLKR